MPLIALLALIAQVVLGVPDFIDLIERVLGLIDGLEGKSQQKVARSRLGEILKAHKDGTTCSAACRKDLEGLADELDAVLAASL